MVTSPAKPAKRAAPAKRKRGSSSVAPLRPQGRSLGDFGRLSRAEKSLLDCCRTGQVAVIGDERPDQETKLNRVRASFVRFLAMGGDERAPVDGRGVNLIGAWLTGVVDLETAEVLHRIGLRNCRIQRIDARDADMRTLNLGGCSLIEGLNGDRLRCRGGIFLRAGFHATGEVRLLGASLSGNVDCSGGRFESDTKALSLDAATISASLILNNGFHATGEVRFPRATIHGDVSCGKGRFDSNGEAALLCDGATIGGNIFLRDGFRASGEVFMVAVTVGRNLECAGGRFEHEGNDALSLDGAAISGDLTFTDGFHATGMVRLLGVKVGGDVNLFGGRFDNEEGQALSCDAACVAGTLFFRYLGGIRGSVDLSGMHVHTLNDDLQSWSFAAGNLIFNGFTYQQLAGSAPMDASTRIAWLELQRHDQLGTAFRPQPWEQASAVLRSTGHADEARAVAIAKHKKRRIAGRYVGNSWLWDLIYGALVGYGYQPWRLLWIATFFWLLCAGAYSLAIRPQLIGSPAPLLASSKAEANIACLLERVAAKSTEPCPRPPPDYSNFVSLAYSAEVLLPVISLGSKAEWRPILSTPDGEPLYWGWVLFLVYWLEIAFGWLAGLLLVAAVGNLVKKD